MSSAAASSFVAGFVPRHAAPVERLRAVLEPEPGFSARPAREPIHFSPKAASVGPKHFSPADPDSNPTEGWDALDPTVEESPEIPALVAAAHAAGYAEGTQAAAAAAQASWARDRALLTSLVEALGRAEWINRDAMAERLRATVLLLVSRLVGEVGVSAELLRARVAAATELLADAGESALLRVHPDDIPLLEGSLPGTVFAAGDAGIARGSFVLESASTMVEDGPEAWLGQLTDMIDRVALPC